MSFPQVAPILARHLHMFNPEILLPGVGHWAHCSVGPKGVLQKGVPTGPPFDFWIAPARQFPPQPPWKGYNRHETSKDTSLFRESLTNAIHFWERARVLYNAILLLVVIGSFAAGYPGSKTALSVDLALILFVLAVLANVAYCTAYIVDILVQMSGYRERWAKYRWALFCIGTLFASVITRFWALALFAQDRASPGIH